MQGIFITAAICTRNRSASLARTLHSLTRMARPASSWELIVVDNGSSDNTADVIRSFSESLPIVHEKEAVPGLSNARNRAIACARGAYIVWTDDDVIVDADWLCAYERAFRDQPDAALFGGRIIPVLEEPCVAWFRDNLALLEVPLAKRDLGDEPVALSPANDCLPFGANFAVRMKEQRQHLYDPKLGVGAGQRRVGEETTVARGIIHAGGFGYWVPGARVDHLIGLERQTTRYIRRYFQAHGETAALQEDSDPPTFVLGVPRWLIRRLAGCYLSYGIARISAGPEVWLKRLIALAQAEGMLAYWRQERAAERRMRQLRSERHFSA